MERGSVTTSKLGKGVIIGSEARIGHYALVADQAQIGRLAKIGDNYRVAAGNHDRRRESAG